MDALEARFKSGEKGALARMILKCAATGRPLPKWPADAYIEAYTALIYGKAASWDDLLGRAHPKGRHLESVRRDLRAHEVWNRVRELNRDKGMPIGDDLFELVGRELGIGGKTIVGRLYAEVEHNLRGLLDEVLHNLRGHRET